MMVLTNAVKAMALLKEKTLILAQTLSAAIEHAGISERQLARETQVPRGTIFNWRTGRNTPSDWVAFARVAQRVGLRFTEVIK